MFFTEFSHGTIFRITADPVGAYVTDTWVTLNASMILGLSPMPNASRMYVVGLADDPKVTCLWSFSTTTPQDLRLEVMLDDLAGNGGNGLGVDARTGIVYTAGEGLFVDGTGAVFQFDPSTGLVSKVANHTDATDGLWIDPTTSIMYVSELINGKVMRWQLSDSSPPQPLTTFSVVPELSLIDDFTVSSDDSGQRVLVYAHYGKSAIESVVIPPVDSSAAGTPTVLVSSSDGLRFPTSVRFGDGSKGFPASSAFVTEGILLSAACRVLRVDF